MKKWTASELYVQRKSLEIGLANAKDEATGKSYIEEIEKTRDRVFVAVDVLVAELKKRRKWNIYGDKVAEQARKNELDDMLEELMK